MTNPGTVLDLTRWKLTLPVGNPTEVTGTALASFVDPQWFTATTAGDAVRFRAPVNGVTTSGSGYPRSELREMNLDGSNASWSAASGAHTLTVVEAFTHLPNGKPHVVGAQIHDSSNDITVFRLEGTNLYVTNGNNTHYKLVTDSYVLGTRFEAKFVVWSGQARAYYNGVLQTTIAVPKLTGAYFKTGVYTQANCGNSSPCSSDNYGETTIYHVTVSHTATPAPAPTPNPAPTPAPTPGPPADTPGFLAWLKDQATLIQAWFASHKP